MRAWLNNIISSPSKTFLTFCCCFIGGSALSTLGTFSPGVQYYLFSGLFILFSALIYCWGSRNHVIFIATLFFVLLGLWRGVITVPNCARIDEVCHYTSSKVIIMGHVDSEPNQKIDGVTYTVAVQSMNTKSTHGTMQFTSQIYPAYSYGDKLEINCRLENPRVDSASTFRYDKYLARYGINVLCVNPVIKQLGTGEGSVVLKYIYTFKEYLNDTLRSLWPEPEGSLMAGILYGSKSGLPPYLTDDFSRTGVSHIIAVSGFNITIIAVVFMSVLIYFGLYRHQAFYVVLLCTWLFVIFSGLSASAIRAGIMCSVVLVARQLGRTTRIGNVLIFTVALMQLANPYLVLWDVGFQLSFLATVGLVYVSPVLQTLVEKITKGKGEKIIEPLVTTLAAIVATFPLILYQFGTFSFIAPLVNVLILWCIPWVMLAGFVAAFGAIIWLPLGKLFAIVGHFGLAYVILVVRYFGEKPWASTAQPIPLVVMVVLYAGIIWLVLKQKKYGTR